MNQLSSSWSFLETFFWILETIEGNGLVQGGNPIKKYHRLGFLETIFEWPSMQVWLDFWMFDLSGESVDVR